MRTKAYNVHIKNDIIDENVICYNVDDICDFLSISKSQYVGLRSNRTKFKRQYNYFLNCVKITKINLDLPERKKRAIINGDDIIKKIHDIESTQ